ncbi:myelin-associated glycoprotein [Stegastes partitus]|uniref:Myelin-associated glycoprotein-like n=1 Tax=Stegastes partitus TaxID=144197 RepID=A0A3B5AF68_9TELE|nr:PREDICTED: myelin-associated glycoprotein-like [Stegastes partitus]
MDKERKMMMFCLLLAGVCSPVFCGEWKASVVKELDALVSSCVVIPCSFTHPGGNLPTSRLRGIWHRKDKRDKIIYHEEKSKALDNFKVRTRLLGELGHNNCTLEITKIKNHDNGPFCFRIELVVSEDNNPTKEKFSYVDECVTLNMLPKPPTPELNPKTAIEGQPYTVTCSVFHTCPSHVPKLSWTGRTGQVSEEHKDIRSGNWEIQSIFTFVPEEKDDHSQITCTAEFFGQITSSKTFTLYVKRTQNYNHIIIPSAVAAGTALIFGLLCIFMAKKYKKRIAELQNQDGSVWNRLSRMSRRLRPDRPGPSHSDHRRSIWSRFSRRPKGETVDFGHTPNNATSCADQKVSKPRFPSPKSQPKSYNYKEDLDDGDDYVNTADLNVYGNI